MLPYVILCHTVLCYTATSYNGVCVLDHALWHYVIIVLDLVTFYCSVVHYTICSNIVLHQNRLHRRFYDSMLYALCYMILLRIITLYYVMLGHIMLNRFIVWFKYKRIMYYHIKQCYHGIWFEGFFWVEGSKWKVSSSFRGACATCLVWCLRSTFMKHFLCRVVAIGFTCLRSFVQRLLKAAKDFILHGA